MNDTGKKRTPLKRELIISGVLFLLGLLLLPVAIYLVGNTLFAEGYGGGNFGDFARDFARDLLSGSLPMWFLVLSPLITISLFRLAIWGVRKSPTVASTS
ncbi:MAG: hypothetical protein AAF385_15010 [Pseudomonadota bacterium]